MKSENTLEESDKELIICGTINNDEINLTKKSTSITQLRQWNYLKNQKIISTIPIENNNNNQIFVVDLSEYKMYKKISLYFDMYLRNKDILEQQNELQNSRDLLKILKFRLWVEDNSGKKIWKDRIQIALPFEREEDGINKKTVFYSYNKYIPILQPYLLMIKPESNKNFCFDYQCMSSIILDGYS